VGVGEDGVVLAHGAEDAGMSGLRRAKGDRDATGFEIEVDGLGAAKVRVIAVDPAGGAEGGMAGEGELFPGGEDADLNAAVTFDPGGAGEDEGGFGEVGLAGDALHVFGGEASGVGKDCEGVAFEGSFGEDIDDSVRERSEVWLG